MSIARYPAPVRLGTFLSILLLLWLPLAIPIYLTVSDRNLVTILTMGLLFVQFLFFLKFWGKNVYGKTNVFAHYGLEFSYRNARDLIRGLSLGLGATLILFAFAGLLGWLTWRQPTISLFQLILEGLISALLIGLAEELVFRGWLLDELEQNRHPNSALWLTSFIFATVHFLKPLPEIIRTLPSFLGLLILGIALVWAKRKYQGRLGKSIGLHAGLVWGYYIVDVGKLVSYSGAVPEWITGVNNNPIAGLLGLFVLLIITYFQKPIFKPVPSDRDKWRRR